MTDAHVQFARICASLEPEPVFFRCLTGRMDEMEIEERAIAMLSSTRDHLMYNRLTSLDLTESWKDKYNQFLFYFKDLSLEKDHTALVDALFVTNCQVLCCKYPSILQQVKRSDFPVLSMKLRVLASQHTVETRQPLNMEYVHHLKLHISAYITQFIQVDYDHSSVVALAKQPCEDAGVRDAYYRLQFSSDEMHRQVEELEQKAREMAINDINTSYEDEYDVGDDDINRGEMFFEKPESVARSFMILAVRVFRCFEVEEAVCTHFSLNTTDTIDTTRLDTFRKWFIGCCEIDVGNLFSMEFRMQAMEFMLPVGARLDTDRFASSVGEIPPVNNIVQKHLGINVGHHLQNQGAEKYLDISKNVKHPMYEMLLLRMFTYMFEMRLGLNFWDVPYIVKPWELLSDPNRVISNALNTTRLFGERRPILFYLLRSWRILYRRQWIVCNSLEEALLTWLYLVDKKFKSELEGGHMIKRFLSDIFPVVDYALEQLKSKKFDR